MVNKNSLCERLIDLQQIEKNLNSLLNEYSTDDAKYHEIVGRVKQINDEIEFLKDLQKA